MALSLSRRSLSLAAAFALAWLAATPNLANAQNAAAEAANTRGKELFKERRYLEAYKAFKEAADASPEGKYYFNMCFALNYLERFEEAIGVCEQVEPNGADAALLDKTQRMLEALRSKVPAGTSDPGGDPGGDPQGGDPGGDPQGGDPGNPGGDPGNPAGGPNPGQGSGPAQIDGMDPFAVAQKAPGAYEWSLGGGLAPIGNLGIGDAAFGDVYNNGFRLNLFGNFMYSEPARIGLQASLGISNLAAEDSDFFDPLTLFDFGGAVYKHIALFDKLEFTPLAGAYISLVQPETATSEALIALGLRLQANLEYALGADRSHVIAFSPALNIYSRAGAGDGLLPEDYGLDSGGATLEFAVQYQYRFTQPFGAGPLFTLE